MINEYQITSSSKKKYLYKILLATLLIHLAILLGYFYFQKIRELYLLLGLFFGVIFGWLIIFALPVIWLYLNHYKYSKNVIFTYDDLDNSFVYKKLSESFAFTVNDVSKIEICMTSAVYEKRTDWLFYGKYHYFTLYTLEGLEITISCLVCDRVEDIFPKELIVRKGRFLPLISMMKTNS